jgi:hypothetical protein
MPVCTYFTELTTVYIKHFCFPDEVHATEIRTAASEQTYSIVLYCTNAM